MTRNNKGFTLIEVIVVLTILGIVSAALTGIIQSGAGSWSRVNNQNELQQNLRFALDNIIKDIRKSKAIDHKSTQEEIILIMADEKTIKYGLKPDNISDEHQFELLGQVLYQEKNDGNRDPVANFIEELIFFYNTSDLTKTTYVEVIIKGRVNEKKTITLKSGAELKWQSFGLN